MNRSQGHTAGAWFADQLRAGSEDTNRLAGPRPRRRTFVAWVLVALLIATCGPQPLTQPSSSSGNGGRAQQTLVIIVRAEPPSLAARPLVSFSASLGLPVRLFNATLDYLDHEEVSQPYLATALPRLHSEDWRIFPDGTMETTHRLRPGLTWHDGIPLTAEDFVFGWRVYATPELGSSTWKPLRQIQQVEARDPTTIVIFWKQSFPEADRLDSTFQALPRHVLERPFAAALESDTLSFANHPFWTVGYLGLGPYRLVQWEPGAYMEATAFDGHVLGQPKIERVRISFMNDANTALATMMTGEAHFVADLVIGYEEGQNLDRHWAGQGGTVFYAPVLIRLSQIQFRPEHVNPKALLDVRVRRALAHGFDVPGAVEVFTGPYGLPTNTLTSPRVPYYQHVEGGITKRHFDPAKGQQLLTESGYTRGGDGIFSSPGGERLQMELWNTGGAVFERENRIFTDSLRQSGIDAVPQTMNAALLREPQYRALVPALFTGGAANDRLAEYSTEAVPKPENRWQGNNRGAWVNPDYERLWQAYNTTLVADERISQIAAMERIFNEDVGAILHYFTLIVTAHSGKLRGPVARMTPDAPIAIYQIWSWDWQPS